MKIPKFSALAPLLIGGALSGLSAAAPVQASSVKPHLEKAHKKTIQAAKASMAKKPETLGGGTVVDPAVGPAPSFGIGGPNMVLVKNWHFGTNGTVKNYADMNANFVYHTNHGSDNNGGEYGSQTVAPDAENAIAGQPIEGINSTPVREFTADSLKTYVTALTPLKPEAVVNGVPVVQARYGNAGNGSFGAKWTLPAGGSHLGQDIVWETKVRYVPPPYFWFALWTDGDRWLWDGHNGQGAEHDLIESFGYNNGGNFTNYDGRYWHSNTVASPSKDKVNYWNGWTQPMVNAGFAKFDASQYHIWTWVYKHDNSFAMYCDGKLVQNGTDYYWGFGNTASDPPVTVNFLFDAGFGHNKAGGEGFALPSSQLAGKFFEFSYSRVYVSGGVGVARNAPRLLPGTVRTADFNSGPEGAAFGTTAGKAWRRYMVRVPVGGKYAFSFTAPGSHLEDEFEKTLTSPATLSTGPHALKWVSGSAGFGPESRLIFTKAPGSTAVLVRTDRVTQGNWKGRFGADGFVIAGDDTRPPAYGTLTRTGWQVLWSGNGLTKDPRALERNGGGADRMAGQWGTNDKTYDLDCNLTDGKLHQVALYGLDWDSNGRNEDIEVRDASTGALLDTQNLSSYVNGAYLVWNVQGHVLFRVVNNCPWTNPALSGIFFDTPAKH
ncbi:MAG: hypothetical protein ACRYFS_06855 [Janthinobacterium lividum]